MTEQEWLASDNIRRMCYFIENKRKLRLFSVACFREIWDLIGHTSKKAIEIIEKYADELVDINELKLIQQEIKHIIADIADENYGRHAMYAIYAVNYASDYSYYVHISVYSAVRGIADTIYYATDESARREVVYAVLHRQRNLLRNIVNPFHKFTFKPSQQARNLADMIYWQKDWQILPILADMLEEEGCTDTILLNHLKTKEQVYRGWWSLDAVRGF